MKANMNEINTLVSIDNKMSSANAAMRNSAEMLLMMLPEEVLNIKMTSKRGMDLGSIKDSLNKIIKASCSLNEQQHKLFNGSIEYPKEWRDEQIAMVTKLLDFRDQCIDLYKKQNK